MNLENPGTNFPIYLLPLTDQGAPDVPGGYICLPPPTKSGYTLRFTIDGASSVCRQGSLWVNFPDQEKPFDRHSFRELKCVSIFLP